MDNDKERLDVLEIFQKLSKEGQREAVFYVSTILKAEIGMRRQYGLLPESVPAAVAEPVAAGQAR